MPDKNKFLSEIQSDDPEVRFGAWRLAGEMPPDVIPQLGELAASSNPGVAKAAREAVSTMVHSVGKETGTARRAEVVKQFLALAGDGHAPAVRALAFRELSLIAGEDAAPAIAKSIHDPEVREEVVFCLERIPGSAPIKALIGSYKDAPADFQPRILAALGHRRAEEAVGLVVEAMRSADNEVAMAGIRAFGRIGKKPPAAPRFPEPAGLSEWQKTDRLDSMLRYADEQVKQGNPAEAMRVYRIALDRPEEHWQCAAVIGIAKIGTPEAAATIFPKLKSGNRTVRLTAKRAWQAMAKAASAS